jgi:lipoprotein-anchoring transpeptidase ErfK/SrfK
MERTSTTVRRCSATAAVLAFGIAAGLAGCVTTSEPSREADPAFARKLVTYASREVPGTIVVDPGSHYLYLLLQDGQAVRYGVGVGGEGFSWSGTAMVHTKQQWPDWYPPAEMLERKPELKQHMVQLQSGVGMHGGPDNPIGARALYLWQGNKDTLYRIHGTSEPWTIGHNVSSGCIRMTNEDIGDLYDRAPVGTKVVVLPTASTPVAAAQ